MKNFILITLLFFVSTINNSCGDANVEINIEGNVVNASDNSPIANAQVDLGLLFNGTIANNTTNVNGYYLIKHIEADFCPETNFYISAYKEGYIPESYGNASPGPNTNYIRCTNDRQIINFKLIKFDE